MSLVADCYSLSDFERNEEALQKFLMSRDRVDRFIKIDSFRSISLHGERKFVFCCRHCCNGRSTGQVLRGCRRIHIQFRRVKEVLLPLTKRKSLTSFMEMRFESEAKNTY